MESTIYNESEREIVFSIPLYASSIKEVIINLCAVFQREDDFSFSLKGEKGVIRIEASADEHDPDYTETFHNSTGRTLEKEQYEEMTEHTFVLYLQAKVSYTIDIVNLFNGMLNLINMIGLGIKVETAGVGFSRDFLNEKYPTGITALDLTKLLVVSVYSDDCVYTCGMKNFGKFKEIVIEKGNLNNNDSLMFIVSVINYLVYDGAVLKLGETIDIDGNPPVFSISSIPYESHGVEIFANPLGAWKLTKIEENEEKKESRETDELKKKLRK